MDSIYWVVSKACNQRCPHCYNNSGPDAPGLDADEVDRVVDNLPDPQKVPVGTIILSGGEVLAWPELLYHSLGRLREKYDAATRIAVQTNGDVLDEGHLDRMLGMGVSHVSIASQDKFHLPQSRRRAADLERLFESRGVRRRELGDPKDKSDGTPEYAMWGANPETWIGPLWPRGRAYVNNLSTATPDVDFCGQWSGALNFLEYDGPPGSGCEVSLQLADVYPCCPMTCRPVGDLLKESLTDILDRCREHPVYRALNEGRPEAMGESMGIPESHGVERSRALGNHCLWCDEFFTKHAPHLLEQNARTERGTIELTINGRRAAGVPEREIRREFAHV